MNVYAVATRYIEKIRAVSGRGGDHATFRAAISLVRGFGLVEAEAWPILMRWNITNAAPPWSQADLRYKLKRALKSTRPYEYLVRNGSRHNGLPPTPPAAEARSESPRPKWPKFQDLTLPEMEEIAQLRKVPIQAVESCCAAGLLKSSKVDGHRAFILIEGAFAQARRFDGQPFVLPSGSSVKAKNLPGSKGRFIGTSWLHQTVASGSPGPVLLVEGAIGLLEGIAAADAVDARAKGWTVLAATSASSRFEPEPELCSQMRGRRVRIVPDADSAGFEAAAKWAAFLDSIGCEVDGFSLPPGCKDLGVLLAEPPVHRHTLIALFTL